jgi:hypothetical protein
MAGRQGTKMESGPQKVRVMPMEETMIGLPH